MNVANTVHPHAHVGRSVTVTWSGWPVVERRSAVLGTKGGRVYDVYAEAVDDDTSPPVAASRKRSRRT